MTLSQNRLHDRINFFKYMPASTAKLVLDNKSLRWSSPILFNDPFDVPRELSFGITYEDIANAVTKRFLSMIENPPENTSELKSNLRSIIEIVQQAKSPDVRLKIIRELHQQPETLPLTSAGLEGLREIWRSWIPHFRILCLTESPEHSAMWYHYADKYKGAVLEFKCDDELDSAWLSAKPVKYPTDKLGLYEAEGWAKLIMMPNKMATKTLLDYATYTKSPDWSYENEWRVVTVKREADTGLFTDYRFDPRELSSIYFGPRISPADKKSLIETASKYSHVRMHKVAIGMNGTFLFTEMTG